MKKAYLKPTMEVMLVQQSQMLCSSTMIIPGENNRPAGARKFGGWDNEPGAQIGNDIWDDDAVWEE